jgi:hypothetical protein
MMLCGVSVVFSSLDDVLGLISGKRSSENGHRLSIDGSLPPSCRRRSRATLSRHFAIVSRCAERGARSPSCSQLSWCRRFAIVQARADRRVKLPRSRNDRPRSAAMPLTSADPGHHHSRPTLSTSTRTMGSSVFIAASPDCGSNSSNPTSTHYARPIQAFKQRRVRIGRAAGVDRGELDPDAVLCL